MNHINSIITNPIFVKQFADYYAKVKSERANDHKWDRFIATSLKPQRAYRVRMRKWFDDQSQDVLKQLNHKAVKSEYDAEQIDWTQYRLQLNEFSQLELPGILTAWASLELEALEVGISFDVTLPEVMDAINARSNLFSDSVVNETRDALHKVIVNGLNSGYGIPQYEKAIRQLYDNMSKYRSTRIARSEVIWAQNEGAEQSYIQSGVVLGKIWWTAKDERTCFYCLAMHKKRIDLGTNYFNKGEVFQPNPDVRPMRLNYEDIRHPGLHPHCRCTLIPEVADI